MTVHYLLFRYFKFLSYNTSVTDQVPSVSSYLILLYVDSLFLLYVLSNTPSLSLNEFFIINDLFSSTYCCPTISSLYPSTTSLYLLTIEEMLYFISYYQLYILLRYQNTETKQPTIFSSQKLLSRRRSLTFPSFISTRNLSGLLKFHRKNSPLEYTSI